MLGRFNRIGFVGSASGWGAQIRGTEKGPSFMRECLLEKSIKKSYWSDMVYPSKFSWQTDIPVGETLPLIVPQLTRLAKATKKVISQNDFPCVIGGDHISGVGTFSGVVDALDAQQNYGLIWIDAHLDAHTPETSPSKAFHGMPIASLLGFGEKQLTNLCAPGPKIKPNDLVMIGIRSFEKDEVELLKKLGVKIYYCDEVIQRGFNIIFDEAIQHVTKNTKAFGVSLDLDVFEPAYCPGVGSPEYNGLLPPSVLPFLKHASQHEKFSCFELVEFNPELDRWNITSNLSKEILKNILV